MPKVARQSLSVFLITALFLAAFNAAGLLSWAYDLPPGPFVDWFLAGVERWHEVMQALYLNDVTQIIRDYIAFAFDG